ncbi:MAG: permease prefix domain 1-containing protein, partial [Gemmatimonadales bacterium]
MLMPVGLRMLLSRLAGLRRRRAADRELTGEVQSHLELLTEEHVRRGLAPDEARAAARRDFGGVEQMKELYRDERGLAWVDAVLRDVQYALRSLRKSPGFVVAVVASLAAGIGVNAVVFTVLNAVLFTPLPVRHAEELVVLTPQARGLPNGAPAARFSYP